MAIRWKGQLEERRLELIKMGYSYSTIANILSSEFDLNISRRSVEGRCYNTKTQKCDLDECDKLEYDTDHTENTIFSNTSNLFPEECYDNEEDFCMTPQKVKELKRIYNKLTGLHPKNVISLSDLHSPAIDFKSVERAILDNPNSDICLLNGDVYDGNSMSSFDKMSEIDIEEELDQVFTLLDVLTKKYEFVVWVGGNHDFGRFLKFVMKNFGPGMRKYVEQRLNPMDYIAEHYDNLIIVPHDWVQIGDVIYAHLPTYSTVDMKTVVKNYEIFKANRHLLPNPNFRAIVIGHTHHLGKIMKNGVMLIEQGCLCHLQDYRFMKLTKNRWQKGYAIVGYDDDMNVDFNKSHAIYL
ncbi:MAG: metallophosphoesterase [archaeon]